MSNISDSGFISSIIIFIGCIFITLMYYRTRKADKALCAESERLEQEELKKRMDDELVQQARLKSEIKERELQEEIDYLHNAPTLVMPIKVLQSAKLASRYDPYTYDHITPVKTVAVTPISVNTLDLIQRERESGVYREREVEETISTEN